MSSSLSCPLSGTASWKFFYAKVPSGNNFHFHFNNFCKGVPLDSGDLTTKFGALNFEDFGLVHTTSTTSTTTEASSSSAQRSNEDTFSMEMNKVAAMLERTGGMNRKEMEIRLYPFPFSVFS